MNNKPYVSLNKKQMWKKFSLKHKIILILGLPGIYIIVMYIFNPISRFESFYTLFVVLVLYIMFMTYIEKIEESIILKDYKIHMEDTVYTPKSLARKNAKEILIKRGVKFKMTSPSNYTLLNLLFHEGLIAKKPTKKGANKILIAWLNENRYDA